MAEFGRPITVGLRSQPVTDVTGALLARASGPVAAYNWLVLLSFPLSAAAAYLLARHLALSRAGATLAAMAYAFSPFHLAHAAYHPHIAQTQWMPLYFLALWRCLDHPSPVAAGLLGAAAIAVTLSNFYGGLIAAVITPVAVAAYWPVMCRADARAMRRLGITVGSLVLIAACGFGVRVVRRPRCPRGPLRVRVPSCRPVPLQREMVELSGSAGRASAARRNGSSRLGRGGRPRRAARTAGEPRLGNRRARAHRRLSVVRPGRSSREARRHSLTRSGSRHRRHGCARVLAVAGADDRRRVHLRPAFRASVQRRTDVPVVRAVRGRRAAHGGSAGRHRGGLSPPGRDQARADRVPRPRGTRRRRVRRGAVGAVARRAADDGAPLGHAAARSRAGPRLHAPQSGIPVSSVVDWPIA